MADKNKPEWLSEITEERVREVAERYGLKVTKAEPGKGGLFSNGKEISAEELLSDWTIPAPEENSKD